MALKLTKDSKPVIFFVEECIITNNDSIEKGFFDKYSTQLKEVIIPEGITTIEANAFEGCFSLESVTLPSSIKHIGPNAFAGCKELKEVILPDSITDIDCWGERRVWKLSLCKPFSDLAEHLIKGVEVEFNPPFNWN